MQLSRIVTIFIEVKTLHVEGYIKFYNPKTTTFKIGNLATKKKKTLKNGYNFPFTLA